jgi:hypothetical protein
LVSITSLSPWDPWVRKPSWNLQTGIISAHDLDRDPEHSLYYQLTGGSGLSFKSEMLRPALFYGLATADLGVGQPFEDDYRIGGGINSGILLEAMPWWRIHFNASYIRYPMGERGEVVKLRLVQAIPFGKCFQGRITLERQNRYKEALFSVLMYL